MICAVLPGHSACSFECVAWNPGEHLTVRGSDWRVVTVHGSSQLFPSRSRQRRGAVARTLPLPFDRPRRLPFPGSPWCPGASGPNTWAHGSPGPSRSADFASIRGRSSCSPISSSRLSPSSATPAAQADRRRRGAGENSGGGSDRAGGDEAKLRRGSQDRASLAAHVQWKEELVASRPALDRCDRSLAANGHRELPGRIPGPFPVFYVSSVDFVKRPEVLGPLESVRWDLLVVDEAHGATPGTGRLAAVDALGCPRINRRLAVRDAAFGRPNQFDALCRIGSACSIHRSSVSAGRETTWMWRRTWSAAG